MTRRAVADRMAGAAAELLEALDDQQRDVAAWPFPASVWCDLRTDFGGDVLATHGHH